MSYYFDTLNRFQIVYPYTSDKIYVEANLSNGADKCYQEIKNKDIKTYIFIVHDIDSNHLYYYNIPKNKKYESVDNIKTNIINNNTNNNTITDDINNITITNNDTNNNTMTNDVLDTKNKVIDDIIKRLDQIEYDIESLKKSIKKNN